MAEYMNKDLFLSSMGLRGDETKYGNHDAEHQHRSYSTYMSYEIMDCVDDSIEEDVAPVVHGRWVDGEDSFGAKRGRYRVCNRCNICIPCVTEVPPQYWQYCPNCGAKMDGDCDG